MKRREIKFVAGSLPLAPDRIEVAPTLRKSASQPRKRPKPGRAGKRELATRTTAAKRR
jgi:hypothetical protein